MFITAIPLGYPVRISAPELASCLYFARTILIWVLLQTSQRRFTIPPTRAVVGLHLVVCWWWIILHELTNGFVEILLTFL